MLWMFQRVMFGQLSNTANQSLLDLSQREIAVLVPIVIFIVWIGVYPTPFLKTSAASTTQIVRMLEKAKSGEVHSTLIRAK
jgi:NADH-quinone oxidoreductase subunit M